MPCDAISQVEQVRRQRERQLKELEKKLKDKTARIVKIGNQVNIDGWTSRGTWCDACAIRRLKQSSDFQVRTMVAQAVPTDQGITFGHGH